MPEGLILTRGVPPIHWPTLAGSRRSARHGMPRFGRPTDDWNLINGELMTLTDPQRDLPPIDRLEGFRSGRQSMY